jgi:chitin synthase
MSKLNTYFVLDGNVVNLDPYIAAVKTPIPGDEVDIAIRKVLSQDPAGGRDATKLFVSTVTLKNSMNCLIDRYYAGHIDKISPGCFVSNLFLYVSLTTILSVVLARFVMACVFNWFLSKNLVKPPSKSSLKKMGVSPAILPEGANIDVGNKTGVAPWINEKKSMANQAVDANGLISLQQIGSELFCVCLVTCYSEGEEGIRNTLSSISSADYSDARKLLFVVCDGIITGSGEKRSTPDIVLGMMEKDARFGEPQPMSYVAVGAGSKAHNMAKIYAGHYSQSLVSLLEKSISYSRFRFDLQPVSKDIGRRS